eukprot:scaffold1430_cov257-Pinguiococcus_pyrenoidosus.AAC.14
MAGPAAPVWIGAEQDGPRGCHEKAPHQSPEGRTRTSASWRSMDATPSVTPTVLEKCAGLPDEVAAFASSACHP